MVQRTFGDFTGFSFCQDKILTTGSEGGLLAMDDDAAWRMLEVQANIGRLQLRKLPTWHERRHAIGTPIDTALCELPGLRVPIVPERLRHASYAPTPTCAPRRCAPTGTANA